MPGLVCIRDQFTFKNTTSKLFYNDNPLCFQYDGKASQVYIGEDVARPTGIKIPKITCIPDGDFFITITYSERFKREMPLIYNAIDPKTGPYVKSGNVRWDGIRQHIGNYDGDTEGCQLVGFTRSSEGVFTSTNCFELYFPWLKSTLESFPSKTMAYKIINQQDIVM